MESNSDKQLRDKLAGTEFPFDPRAWEQMEAMLDKKKKRRGFFWWWTTGGIAAALLFGVIGYEVGVSNGRLQVAGNRLNSLASESMDRSSQSSVNTERKIAQSTSDSQQEQLNNTLRGQKQNESVTNEVNSTLASPSEKKTQRSSLAKHTNPGFSAGIAGVNAGKGVSYDRKNLRKQGGKKALLAKQGAGMNAGGVGFEEIPAQSEVMTLASATSSQSLLAQRIEMDRRAGLLEAEEEQYSFDKKSEDALPKIRKKIFQYSLGCVGGGSYVTVGKQDWNTNRRTYPAATYAVGLTNDFLFVQRVAITASFLFSQTSFIISNPKTHLVGSKMIYYSSRISELAIPIGIKVYPVVKRNFRLYINVGIINHIKLKETFAYTISKDSIVFNSIASLADVNTLSAETKFSGTSNTPNTQGVPNSTSDYSINNAKRYYASFYASAGIEFIAKKHFIFFTEPMFYMSLNKIGVQDKRKYNVGANAGFRYQF